MRRYWVEEKQREGEGFWLEGELYHHVIDVCRQEEGQHFELLCGEGQAYLVQLKSIDKKRAWTEIIEVRQIEPLSRPHIHLAVSLPRFHKMDEIVEKAVELGVKSVWPFVSDCSFVRHLSKVSGAKQERWTRIVRSATQQSGRGDWMEVQEPKTLLDLFAEFNQRTKVLGLFPYEGESQLQLHEALRAPRDFKLEEVWVFVGSEGGYSAQEVQWFRDRGLEPVTLGPQVLRVETACLALVSIIKYELCAVGK